MTSVGSSIPPPLVLRISATMSFLLGTWLLALPSLWYLPNASSPNHLIVAFPVGIISNQTLWRQFEIQIVKVVKIVFLEHVELFFEMSWNKLCWVAGQNLESFCVFCQYQDYYMQVYVRYQGHIHLRFVSKAMISFNLDRTGNEKNVVAK